jgi:hypothetical protein
MAGKYLAKYRDSLDSQSLMYAGDRQSPLDLANYDSHDPKVMTHIT